MTITQQQPATVPDLDTAWELYARLFGGINDLAAQRHLMTATEFAEVFHDPRILKFYVHDTAGCLAGMSVMTRDLDAWPLISPQFFAHRWPQHFIRRAIWYVGFVGAAPRQLHGFRELVAGMYTHVAASSGIAVMDFCDHNTNGRRLPAVTHRLLGSINPAAAMEVADAQTFVVYRFDGRDV